MAFTLPKLDFETSALAPHISEQTMKLHHGVHHQTYITNLNNIIEGTDLADKSLEELIKFSANNESYKGLFNNAGQTWNHNFFWKCLSPNGGGKPSGILAERIDADFGSYEAFAEAFTAAAIGRFGSGWAWLVEKDGKLACMNTLNGDNPIAAGVKPVLGLDVWEHAYYLDYHYKRAGYVKAFLDNLANWEFAAAQL